MHLSLCPFSYFFFFFSVLARMTFTHPLALFNPIWRQLDPRHHWKNLLLISLLPLLARLHFHLHPPPLASHFFACFLYAAGHHRRRQHWLIMEWPPQPASRQAVKHLSNTPCGCESPRRQRDHFIPVVPSINYSTDRKATNVETSNQKWEWEWIKWEKFRDTDSRMRNVKFFRHLPDGCNRIWLV